MDLKQQTPVVNRRVTSMKNTRTPDDLKMRVPISFQAEQVIRKSREDIEKILDGIDDRFIVIVGPCSIHNIEAAKEYAKLLSGFGHHLTDHLLVLMRCYFEKPRTTIGWKGLINEPDMDGVFDIDRGRYLARELLEAILQKQLPTVTEFLDPNTPQYIGDLISFAAIGARTIESQTHREMAAGLSMPVAFKNGTSGDIKVAVNAMLAARSPHSFTGIGEHGREAIVQATGNPYGCLVLRGGSSGPNYDYETLRDALGLLAEHNLPQRIIVDASHANASGDYRKQSEVVTAVLDARSKLGPGICGIMLESNIKPGRQKQDLPKELLDPHVSVTDACIGWEETEQLLTRIYHGCR
jgi:3-deoxy-7-phosphoheptulonate synthase